MENVQDQNQTPQETPKITESQDAQIIRVKGGKVTLEAKVTLDLDDSKLFDLNGKGIKMALVTEN